VGNNRTQDGRCHSWYCHLDTHADRFEKFKINQDDVEHKGRIVLVPQPNPLDVNDPLRWPRWKKEAFFWTLALGAALTGATGHAINAGFADIAKQWGVPVNAVSSTNAYTNLSTGIFTLFEGALATKFGKRPNFLFASLIWIISMAWAASSQGYNSFVGARALSGLGIAVWQALPPAAIGDTFYVHERGVRLAIFSLCITLGINIAPLANGGILIHSGGWRKCYYILLGVVAFHFLLLIFFMPESTYRREAVFNTDEGARVSDAAVAHRSELIEAKGGEPTADGKENVEEQEGLSAQPHRYIPQRTYLQSLHPIPYISNASMIQTLWRPFPFLLSPVVVQSFIAYGLTVVWLVIVSIIYSEVFALPPYRWHAKQVGNSTAGPLIGSILGTIVAGPLVDYSARLFSRWNKGVYEPEFRLPVILPGAILMVIPFVGWGYMAGRQDIPWIGPVMMYSILSFGQVLAAAGSITYLLDTHKRNAPEVFALINLGKDVVLYGLSKDFNGWVVKVGVRHMMFILAGVTAFSLSTALPMYIFGKSARYFIATHNRFFAGAGGH